MWGYAPNGVKDKAIGEGVTGSRPPEAERILTQARTHDGPTLPPLVLGGKNWLWYSTAAVHSPSCSGAMRNFSYRTESMWNDVMAVSVVWTGTAECKNCCVYLPKTNRCWNAWSQCNRGMTTWSGKENGRPTSSWLIRCLHSHRSGGKIKTRLQFLQFLDWGLRFLVVYLDLTWLN